MLFQCWPSVADAGPTLNQHWVSVSCLLVRCPVLITCPNTAASLSFPRSFPAYTKHWPNAGSMLKQHLVNVLCLLCISSSCSVNQTRLPLVSGKHTTPGHIYFKLNYSYSIIFGQWVDIKPVLCTCIYTIRWRWRWHLPTFSLVVY